MLRWAAASRPDLATRIPLRYWPDTIEPADYLDQTCPGALVLPRFRRH